MYTLVDAATPSFAASLDCAGKSLDLSQPAIMGVINLTPNSFYAPSRVNGLDAVCERAQQMVAEGARIIDVGGEATSPWVDGPLTPQQEIDRVVPVVERLAAQLPVPISVDTSCPQVMRAAIANGAGLINDVRALRAPGAVEVLAQTQVPICLMHMLYPDTSSAPAVVTGDVGSVLSQVMTFLQERIQVCVDAGIARERLIIDPGFGNGSFGKSTPQNYHLLKHLQAFHEFGLPLLVGLSRKTFVGDVTKRPPEGRLAGSIALHAWAMLNGAQIIRTHDVQETYDALAVLQATIEGYDGSA